VRFELRRESDNLCEYIPLIRSIERILNRKRWKLFCCLSVVGLKNSQDLFEAKRGQVREESAGYTVTWDTELVIPNHRKIQRGAMDRYVIVTGNYEYTLTCFSAVRVLHSRCEVEFSKGWNCRKPEERIQD
jgi:hypothetical protein